MNSTSNSTSRAFHFEKIVYGASPRKCSINYKNYHYNPYYY